MGQTFSKWFGSLFKKKVRGLMLGLDCAGKTTILYSLKLNEIVKTIPTIGFNVENINYKNLDLTIWDIGGQEKLRRLWNHYFLNTDLLIYVIDSNDRGRLETSSEELHYILNNDLLSELKAVLIFCNKVDLPNSINPQRLIDILKLNQIKKPWYVQPCCAIKNDGIHEGFNWLSKTINS
jgi:small GTP-binding protein